jgi:hypothetical protein
VTIKTQNHLLIKAAGIMLKDRRVLMEELAIELEQCKFLRPSMARTPQIPTSRFVFSLFDDGQTRRAEKIIR